MKIIIFYIVLFFAISLSAQSDKTMEFGGIEREYLEYVPEIYDGTEAVPLVLCLHGLGGTKEHFFNIGMNFIADTANFIVLTPEALNDIIFDQETGNAWNSGASQFGYVLNEDIDDVGFLMALIDSTKALYNIDASKIYVTGYSMGGFMSNKLACERSGELAAIASVAGTMGSALFCETEFPISVCHFHGTLDEVVSYTENDFGNNPEDLIDYWRAHNNCAVLPFEESLPDIVDDGKNIDYSYYGNGDLNTTVEFYKVNNGVHEWLYLPESDISYTEKIWKFFRGKKNLSLNIVGIEESKAINVFPNPASHFITINTGKNQSKILYIYALDGVLIKSHNLNKNKDVIDVSDLNNGMYILSIANQSQKLIINKD